MGFCIHARQSRLDGTVLYRVWNTVVDAYETEPLGEQEIKDYLLERERARMERALLRYPEDVALQVERAKIGWNQQLNSPRWEQERCQECSWFHHPFKPSSQSPTLCRSCDEEETCQVHGPPCETKNFLADPEKP